jgi:very-short-patch-repair endonuclease
MRNRSSKARLARTAGRQWGRVTWAQLRGLGIDRAVIERWLAEGYLHRRLPRVYAVGHSAGETVADLAEALLYAGPGAMLSHATAAWWRGLLDEQPRRIHLSTPRQCRSLPGITVRGRRTCERVWHNGLPLTPLPQILLDLAAGEPLRTVRRALAKADYAGILDVRAIEAELGPGRPGAARLRGALTEHQPRLALTKSGLETLLLEICEKGRIQLPEVNVRVAGWEVDALWRERRIAVELDGYRNHRSPAQVRRDRRKELALRAAGYFPVRYSEEQLTRQQQEVIAELRRMHAT